MGLWVDPLTDIINPIYDTIKDDHIKTPVKEPTSYDDVIILKEVKMTANPAYAVLWIMYVHAYNTVLVFSNLLASNILLNECTYIFQAINCITATTYFVQW